MLGENGSGKSTLVAVLSGLRRHDEGELLLDGAPVRFRSPRQARAAGIATVWQDLAVAPLLSVWRNFFLGAEPTRGVWPLRRLDIDRARGDDRAGDGPGRRDRAWTPTSRPARCRPASGRAWRSPGRCTSAPAR